MFKKRVTLDTVRDDINEALRKTYRLREIQDVAELDALFKEITDIDELRRLKIIALSSTTHQDFWLQFGLGPFPMMLTTIVAAFVVLFTTYDDRHKLAAVLWLGVSLLIFVSVFSVWLTTSSNLERKIAHGAILSAIQRRISTLEKYSSIS